MKDIVEKINSIEAEDLYFVEKDLCFYEKISIAFLLFADNKPNAEYILQKLLILSPTPAAVSDILSAYTKINKNWKPYIVEALAIIKANRVLRKLGFFHSEIRTHFLPHIPEMCLRINPILKALYYICEMLTPVDAGKLVLDIRDAVNTESPTNHLRFYNFDCLEMFLLDWITKQTLDASGTDLTNISILIDYCKLNDKKKIKAMLEYSVRSINYEDIDNNKMQSLELVKSEMQPNANVMNNKSLTLSTPHYSPPPLMAIKGTIDDSDLDNCYKINRESAGFILIINQREFHASSNPELKSMLPVKSLSNRIGTDKDKLRLSDTFSSFGYKPILMDNLNHIEVLSKIREFVKRSVMYDSIIVCILSHGFEGSVFACDSIPIKIDQIKDILTADSLYNKPKMLIIQACQGETLQIGRDSNHLENDAPSRNVDYFDMLTPMSTVPGFASFRHIQTGSWFIQTLCDKVNDFGDRLHMLDILTKVNAAIGDKRGFNNECMTSMSAQTLRKNFRLPIRMH